MLLDDTNLVGASEEELEKAQECQTLVLDLIKTDGKLTIPKEHLFLLRFIRAKKYKPDIVYQNLTKYYEARRKYPKNFENFLPSKYRHVLESGCIALLKHRDELQRKTFVFRSALWDPSKISMEEVSMASVLVAEQMSWCPLNQCVGAIILVDQIGLGLDHMKQATLPALHKLIMLLQECFPGRYKAMHVVNQPYVLDLLFNLMKRFIAKRLQSRIKLHRNTKSLTELVSPSILPISLGGTLSEEEAFDDELLPKMLEMEPYYKELSKYGFR